MKRILSGAAGLALIVFAIGFVASAARADTITEPVGTAGSVTFSTDGGVLALVSANAAEGWIFTVDREDESHLKVTFQDAGGAEVEFEAELEDGSLTITETDEADEADEADDEDSDEADEADDEDSDEADEADDEDSDEADEADHEDSDEADEADDADDEDSDDNSGPGNGDDTDDDDEDDDSDETDDDDEDDDDDDEVEVDD